jgi:hypothetical protein
MVSPKLPFNNDPHGYTIRYFKGALMLEAFREHLGDAAFFDTGRGFYESIRGRSVGTGDFRAYWTKVLREDDLLTSWLDSAGSVPVSGPAGAIDLAVRIPGRCRGRFMRGEQLFRRCRAEGPSVHHEPSPSRAGPRRCADPRWFQGRGSGGDAVVKPDVRFK